jgi:actin-like ATPase involved in cell morphogenesis
MTQLAVDLGSAVLRVRGPDGRAREHAHTSGVRPVRRGRVDDADSLVAALRSLVPRRARWARGTATLSLSTDTDQESADALVSLAARALSMRRVDTVPAAVAALRGARHQGPALVVDLGAELAEVCRVGADWRHEGVALPWGVRDLQHDLARHVSTQSGVAPVRLGTSWAGSVVAGRCQTSGAVRVVRVTTADVDTVVDDRMGELARAVRALAGPGFGGDYLLVGGGSLVVDLRHRLDAATSVTWCSPPDPMHAVLDGLV